MTAFDAYDDKLEHARSAVVNVKNRCSFFGEPTSVPFLNNEHRHFLVEFRMI